MSQQLQLSLRQEFEANVLALLWEAERRYEIFACRAMEAGEFSLEDFFADLATLCRMELEDAMMRGYASAPPTLAKELETLREQYDSASASWLGHDGLGDLRVLLAQALDACRLARAYYSRVLLTAPESATRRAAQAYAQDEAAVLSALEQWVTRLTV